MLVNPNNPHDLNATRQSKKRYLKHLIYLPIDYRIEYIRQNPINDPNTIQSLRHLYKILKTNIQNA
jgi:hypothetical protein